MKEERGASLKKLIKENKFVFLILIIIFLWLPIGAIIAINKVESGQTDRESVMIPIGSIYNLFGYWPAVLFLPICYIASAAFIIYKFIFPPKN